MPPIYTSNSCSTLVDANDNDDLLGKLSLSSSPYAPLVLGNSVNAPHTDQDDDYLLNTCLQLPSAEDEDEHDMNCCFYDENQIHKSLSEYDLSEYDTTDDTDTDYNTASTASTSFVNEEEEKEVQYLRLPASSANISTDQYLSNHPEHYAHAQRRLQQASSNNYSNTSYDDDDSLPSITVSSNESRSDYSIKPLIYIHQREVGYVSSLQYNQNGALLCSDSATTCHLLALRSTSLRDTPHLKNSSSSTQLALGSLSHLDSIGQEDCIRKMITTHVQFHSQNNNYSNDNKPIMEIHLAGGFNDERGHSAETTDYLLNLLSDLAFEYKDRIRMKLSTCIVSTLNDTKHMGMMTTTTMSQEEQSRHVVGGMSLDVNTGKLTLLHSIDDELRGPDSTLRHVRLWSSSPQVKNVSTVHRPTFEGVTIEPFYYEPFPDMETFENLPDELILEYTSTSPHCEPYDFCNVTRKVCRFIREENVVDVFGEEGMEQDIVHLWEGNNCWEKRSV
jgi:hypothetical protein